MKHMDGQTDLLELMIQPVGTQSLDVGTLNEPGNLDDMVDAKRAHFQEFNVDNGNWKPYRGLQGTWVTGHRSDHHAQCFDADLRCQHYWRNPCQCVGSLVYRVYCAGCDWWGSIHDKENRATEEYLDHCWPGWRELPVIESTMKPNGGYTYAFPSDYPAEWQVPGSPIRTCRGADTIGGRHVPGRSPYGGVDAAVIRKCKKHGEKERTE